MDGLLPALTIMIKSSKVYCKNLVALLSEDGRYSGHVGVHVRYGYTNVLLCQAEGWFL